MRSTIVNKNGVNYIAVDGKILDNLAFRSFRPTENNVSDFYQAGVKIFHVFCSGLPTALKVPYSLYGETWFGDKDYRFENLDRQIEFFINTAPDAYVLIDVHLDTRKWWLAQHPECPDSYNYLSQIAADKQWKKDTADYLKALIEHVEQKYSYRVLGYFLLGGFTTEWFSQEDREETHPIKEAAFQEYMKDEHAHIPTLEEREKPAEQIFLDPVKDCNLIAYRKFHNKLIADVVLDYCHEAQKVLQHQKILGVFFGYIMELEGASLWNRGHLDNDRVYRSADIDFFATPTSYQFRGYEEATAYMLLTDTLDLNGKMYFSEFDNITFTITNLLNNPRRLSKNEDEDVGLTHLLRWRSDRLETREKTIHGIRREFMQRMAKRTGMWWFDMLEGWYYDDGLMEEIKRIVDSSEALMDVNRDSVSEIAVFVSCESMYYVNKCSDINSELICNQRDALSRIGAPYDLYSLNDMERINLAQYKLCIFLDALYLTDAQRNYINQVIKADGRSLLFVGACDYAGDDALSLERIRTLAEMNINMLEKDENMVCAYDSSYGYKDIKHPTPFVEDNRVAVLGSYKESGLCALACKEAETYAIYYSGLGNLSHQVLREIARKVGVHIYAEDGIPVYVNSGVAGVYNTQKEFTNLTLREDGEYKELFSGQVYRTHNRQVTLPTGECPAQMLVLHKTRDTACL